MLIPQQLAVTPTPVWLLKVQFNSDWIELLVMLMLMLTGGKRNKIRILYTFSTSIDIDKQKIWSEWGMAMESKWDERISYL